MRVLAQDVIRNHLSKMGQLELLGVYRTAPEAQTALQDLDVDVLFLDIRFTRDERSSSFFLARPWRTRRSVVLTTAYAEYALESYEFNVIDYLLKTDLIRAVFSKAVNKIPRRPPIHPCKHAGGSKG